MDAGNKECPSDTNFAMQALPKVGMVFQSEDQAYDFYNQYAKSVGFSVRKDSSTVRPDGTIIRRVLCCSKQGFYKNNGSLTNLRARTRTGCEARIIILRRGDNFLLIEFKEFHNHELVAPSEVHRLRSQRKIEDSQAKIMRNMYREGLGAVDVYSSICRRFGGPQNLSFTKADCAKYLHKIRRDDNIKKGARSGSSMMTDCHPSFGRSDDRGNPMTLDCQRPSQKSDDLGSSMVIDCHPSSTLQTNDLAHLALTIVAKGNSSENSVVYTRRLLIQVLEELDYFLKSEEDKTQHLVHIRDLNHEKVGEGMNCVGKMDASITQDLPHKKLNDRMKGKMKGTSERVKRKKICRNLPTGSCDQVSIGTIGTTLLMLQDPSVLPAHQHKQAWEQPNPHQDDSVK